MYVRVKFWSPGALVQIQLSPNVPEKETQHGPIQTYDTIHRADAQGVLWSWLGSSLDEPLRLSWVWTSGWNVSFSPSLLYSLLLWYYMNKIYCQKKPLPNETKQDSQSQRDRGRKTEKHAELQKIFHLLSPSQISENTTAGPSWSKLVHNCCGLSPGFSHVG